MYALTDFTEENGATRIIPGSHKLDTAPEFGKHYDSISAEMSKGSVLVWPGNVWHGGGENTMPDDDPDSWRTGLAMNYCDTQLTGCLTLITSQHITKVAMLCQQLRAPGYMVLHIVVVVEVTALRFRVGDSYAIHGWILCIIFWRLKRSSENTVSPAGKPRESSLVPR